MNGPDKFPSAPSSAPITGKGVPTSDAHAHALFFDLPPERESILRELEMMGISGGAILVLKSSICLLTGCLRFPDQISTTYARLSSPISIGRLTNTY
jgi:hypothetical protein